MAGKIESGESVADIGTDHGYVPMLLVKNGISPFAIMSDISEGSLAKARETFGLCGIDMSDECFRLGDGLKSIEPAEVDAIIIGGLGGFTIIDILSNNLEKTRSYKKLVLQPRKHSGELRHFLYTNGFDITDEDLAREGKFACEVITARPSDKTKRDEPMPAGDIRWKYPQGIIKANPMLAKERIEWKLSSIEEQIDSLKRAGTDRSGLIEGLRTDSEYLRRLLSQIH